MFNEGQNKIGFQYNCFGELHTSMDLVVTGLFPSCEALFEDDNFCSDDFYFGYQPNVVACCGEYDAEFKSVYQQFCIYDLYEQICFSLSEHLEYLVQQGDFGAYSAKGADLQAYVAAHQKECWDAFAANNIAEVPHVQTYWALPDNCGLLADVVFHIDAGSRIDGVNGPPEEEGWMTCEGADYNNDTVFGSAGQQPLGGVSVGVDLATPVHAALSGPVIFGGAVSASVDFGTHCTSIGCARAEFSFDPRGSHFGLEAFALFGESFEISNGTYSLDAERVQVQLYAQAPGEPVLDPTSGVLFGYEIPAGEASFLVAGVAGNSANRFMALNATSIWVLPGARGGWEIDALLLEYEDGSHERWTLMVEESQWR